MNGEDHELKGFLGLRDEERELDNLTKFNTTHNKRIPIFASEEGQLTIRTPKRKRKNSRVTFNEEDEIINPEDVDPSLGCFQNRGRTVMVPVKKRRIEAHGSLSPRDFGRPTFTFGGGLHGGLPPPQSEASAQPHGIHGAPFSSNLPVPYPNLVPEAYLNPVLPSIVNMNPTSTPAVHHAEAENEPTKKKYAKEVWPGIQARNPHLPY